MAGVTGPCPDCGASITAPATSTKAPENDPGAAPIKKKPFTSQDLSLAPQIDHQDGAAVGIQAEDPDAEKYIIPESPSLTTHQPPRQRPSWARWLTILLPLSFLGIACIVILIILQLVGLINISEYNDVWVKPDKKTEVSSASLEDISAPESGKPGSEANNPEIPATPSHENSKDKGALTGSKNLPSTSDTTSSDTGTTNSPEPKAINSPPATKLELPPKTVPAPLPDKKASSSANTGILANQNLEKFLKAKTLNDRLPVMSKVNLSPEELKASSLAGELKPVKSIQLIDIVSRTEDNMTQHLYSVSFQDPKAKRQRLRIFMQLVERPGIHPPLVHADAFVEHYEKKLAQYAKQPSKDITTLHCIAEARTSDLAKELPEELKKSMVRLLIKSHPYDEPIFNAYLNKKSPLMKHIGSNKDLPYTSSRLCVLSFLWNTTDPNHPYIELKDIVTLTWEK
jgi:hypothetical protein